MRAKKYWAAILACLLLAGAVGCGQEERTPEIRCEEIVLHIPREAGQELAFLDIRGGELLYAVQEKHTEGAANAYRLTQTVGIYSLTEKAITQTWDMPQPTSCWLGVLTGRGQAMIAAAKDYTSFVPRSFAIFAPGEEAAGLQIDQTVEGIYSLDDGTLLVLALSDTMERKLLYGNEAQRLEESPFPEGEILTDYVMRRGDDISCMVLRGQNAVLAVGSPEKESWEYEMTAQGEKLYSFALGTQGLWISVETADGTPELVYAAQDGAELRGKTPNLQMPFYRLCASGDYAAAVDGAFTPYLLYRFDGEVAVKEIVTENTVDGAIRFLPSENGGFWMCCTKTETLYQLTVT